MQRLKVSQRRACRVLGQLRSTQRHTPRVSGYQEALIKRTVELAEQYGRYGYRMITGLLRLEGWRVNHKRIERIWRRKLPYLVDSSKLEFPAYCSMYSAGVRSASES